MNTYLPLKNRYLTLMNLYLSLPNMYLLPMNVLTLSNHLNFPGVYHPETKYISTTVLSMLKDPLSC